jgi:uncharacterized protein (TIGR02646 family)
MRSFIHTIDWPRNLYNRFTSPVTPRTKNWKRYKHKSYIQDNLLIIQNNICSYCEIELNRDNGHVGFHIEHIQPKSKFPARTFDYTNLMLSCFTTKKELQINNIDKKSLSCGHFKDNNFCNDLFISPAVSNSDTFFQYELDGRITPVYSLDRGSKAKALYTIRRLNLNCTRLIRERQDLIENIFIQISKIGYEGNNLQIFSSLELSIQDGKAKSFITTREQYLRDFV